MIVLTAGTEEYRRIIDEQERRCLACGYRHEVYDLGGLGRGVSFSAPAGDLESRFAGGMPRTTFKTTLIAQTLAIANETVCWLDGDCLPLLPFDPQPGNWDVAVTLRPESEVGASGIDATDWLNAGVLFVKPSLAGSEFMRCWTERCASASSDQDALNQVVGPHFDKAGWNTARNSIIRCAGFGVLILSCPEWNCWHFPAPEGTRILHFKRGIRGMASPYLNVNMERG